MSQKIDTITTAKITCNRCYKTEDMIPFYEQPSTFSTFRDVNYGIRYKSPNKWIELKIDFFNDYDLCPTCGDLLNKFLMNKNEN